MTGRAIRKICLIQPSQPFPNMMSRVVMPRYGLPLIATILKNHGYDVTLFVEEIRPINWDIVLQADAVGLHTLSCSVGNFARIAEKIRAIRPDMPIIVGGTHATYFPESVLPHCDFIVRQEGDETLPDLLNALAEGRDPQTVAGLTFKVNGETVRTPDRPPVKEFDTVVDLKTIYGWEDLYRKRRGRFFLMTIQTSRGCPFRCQFCPVTTMFSPGYRKRGIESVVEELRDKTRYSKYVMFVDNNFAADPRHTRRLLEAVIAAGIRAHITVFCRSEIHRHPDLLRLMKKAGVTTIFIGVESLNPDTLSSVNKCQTAEQTEKAIRAIRRAGIRVLASMIMGVDTDTVESLAETRRLLVKWRIAQLVIFCYFGAYPDNNKAGIPPNRWIFKDWGYINGNFVTHMPKNMKPSTLQREVAATYEAVLSPRLALLDLLTGRLAEAAWRLIFWRAWRMTRPEIDRYIPYLEDVEANCYSAGGELIEEATHQRPELPWIMAQMR